MHFALLFCVRPWCVCLYLQLFSIYAAAHFEFWSQCCRIWYHQQVEMYLAIEWITVECNHLADQALSCCVDMPAFWEQLCFNFFFFYTRLRKRIDHNNNVYLFILFMIILIDTCPLGAMHVLNARVQKRRHREIAGRCFLMWAKTIIKKKKYLKTCHWHVSFFAGFCFQHQWAMMALLGTVWRIKVGWT